MLGIGNHRDLSAGDGAVAVPDGAANDLKAGPPPRVTERPASTDMALSLPMVVYRR